MLTKFNGSPQNFNDLVDNVKLKLVPLVESWAIDELFSVIKSQNYLTLLRPMCSMPYQGASLKIYLLTPLPPPPRVFGQLQRTSQEMIPGWWFQSFALDQSAENDTSLTVKTFRQWWLLKLFEEQENDLFGCFTLMNSCEKNVIKISGHDGNTWDS